MSMGNQAKEAAANAVAQAPRVTLDLIESKIVNTEFFTAGPHKAFTFCVLTLENGFNVSGESACADPANYNKELGEKIAFENAKGKIWALEGYLLRDVLYCRKVLDAAQKRQD